MGATLSQGPKKGAPTPEINVTPLVDVVLVLLIIFMVVTPAIDEGAQLELPETANADDKKKDEEPISVILAPGGRILLEKVELPDQQALATRLKGLVQADAERKIML
ncbi:MAG: biopolymer transporter ExbD, partial [Myxococcota bacterium]